MEQEESFILYLTAVRTSSRTGLVLNPRVSRDIVRRCKTVEGKFGIRLAKSNVLNELDFLSICKKINENKLTSTERDPYRHNNLTHALRVYKEFLQWYEVNDLLKGD